MNAVTTSVHGSVGELCYVDMPGTVSGVKTASFGEKAASEGLRIRRRPQDWTSGPTRYDAS